MKEKIYHKDEHVMDVNKVQRRLYNKAKNYLESRILQKLHARFGGGYTTWVLEMLNLSRQACKAENIFSKKALEMALVEKLKT